MKRLRIAQVSTLSTPVRRTGSGSVEGLVWLLTQELMQLGHHVTVFGTAGSETGGEVVATLPGPYGKEGSPDNWQLCEWINLCRAVEQSERFDVIHSHTYLWGLPLQGLSRAPLVHTTHVCPLDEDARLWSLTPGASVTGLSRYQWSKFPELVPAGVIGHGVSPAQFTFREQPEDYVCYLGRFTPGKGPKPALAAAQALGLPLVLAGPRNAYYTRAIEPLVDGHQVRYLGYLAGAARDRLLGGARALLYPIRDPEPFGLVMVEAMMCGTPVAAIRMGAVPEVLDEGVTGYSAPEASEFVEAVRRALTLDRRQVRDRAIQRFTADRMARGYLELYQRLAGQVAIGWQSAHPLPAGDHSRCGV